MDGHVDTEKCIHDNVPVFTQEDAVQASRMSVEEIRDRWPRTRCSKCGCILYASMTHYLMGDW